MTVDMLILDRLCVARGGTRIITDISAALPCGSIVGICGPNGAGKSTLLAAIANVIPCCDGSIQWQDRRLAPSDFSFMPQALGIRAKLSVLEIVLLGRLDRLRWTLTAEDIDAAREALELVGMKDLAPRAIGTLSGGQQQLVLLAQRLIRRPPILLLDEPTSALDLRRQLVVLDILKAYAQTKNALIVIALHDLTLAARYCDQLLLLQEGKLACSGQPTGVLTRETIGTVYGVEAEILATSNGTPVIAPLAPAYGTPR